LDTPVIDFHTHAGGWGVYAMEDDPYKFVRVMDAAGVDKSCVNCIFYSEAARGNDVVAALMSRAPDRFVGVGFATPQYPDEAISELERCFDRLGMKFLKIYPDYLGKPVDDPAYYPIYEWMDERGLVIMSHSSFKRGDDELTAPRKFIGLAERFSNIKWVLGHSGNAPPGQEQAVEAGRACPNIYLETCTSYGAHGTIEFLVDGVGDDRVLYGSDMPLMDARYQVGRIATADIPADSKRKILGLNAIKLLDLEV